MCGIAGCINISKQKVSEKKVDSMLSALKHRGPDSIGKAYGMGSHIKLGMTRLAIIDVKTGQQPFYSEDGKIIVIGNGEIYNYKDLYKKLKKKHKFKSGSDIEVVLHLYEEYGVKIFKMLKGMFAIAIYDSRDDKLILARDRWGEKPLYYSFVDNNFYFSSEFKSLLKIKNIDKALSFDAINAYLHYYYVPEWQTLLKNVKKLDAGSYSVIDTKNGDLEIYKYWNTDTKIVERKNLKAKIQKTFTLACERTMMADVPVGLTLSGGFDSAAVAATLAEHSGNLTTFTIGYNGISPTDERSHAKQLAKHFGFRHVDYELKEKDVVADFPKMIIFQDDPIADIAAAGVNAVSKIAHKHGMKVLINGAGGDEQFWGYAWVRKALAESTANKSRIVNFASTCPAFIQCEQFINKLLSEDFKDKTANLAYNITPKLDSNSKLSKSKFYMKRIRDMWLQPDVLVIADRLGMRYSIETRSPLVDADLTDLALNTKQILLSWQKGHKYWMKEALNDRVPEFVFKKKKQGFTPPVTRWIYEILKNYIYLFDNGFLVQYGILDKNKLKFAKKSWLALPIYWYAYYQLLVLEIWGRHYLMGQDFSD